MEGQQLPGLCIDTDYLTVEHKSQTNCYKRFDQVTSKVLPAPARKSVITLFQSHSVSTKYHSRLVPAMKKSTMSQSERMSKWKEPPCPLVLGAAVEGAVGQTKSCVFLHRFSSFTADRCPQTFFFIKL